MKFAQRGGSVSEQTEQQVEYIDGQSATELAVKVSDIVAKYAVRVVTMTAWGQGYSHHAIVVFEEEPSTPSRQL